jgi:hypothetical protein
MHGKFACLQGKNDSGGARITRRVAWENLTTQSPLLLDSASLLVKQKSLAGSLNLRSSMDIEEGACLNHDVLNQNLNGGAILILSRSYPRVSGSSLALPRRSTTFTA